MSDLSIDDFNEDNDDGANGSDDSASVEKPDESKTPKTPKSDKRVTDLQSKADQETARANKLQKQLDAIAAATKEPGSDGGNEANPSNASVDPAIIDMARMFAYQQNPRLADYGVEMSDISGSTPSEVAKNAAELVARFEKIETIARNKVLAEQGLAPEITSSGTPSVKRNFETMPKEDFDKFVDAAMKGQRL